MAESFITQCPHCGTSFRVRTEQLTVANGSVRCGACLQVFSARNHVVTGAIPTQKPITPVAPIAQPKKTAVKAPASKTPQIPKATPPEPDFSNFTSDDDDDSEFLFADADDLEEEFLFSDGPDDKLFDEDAQEEGFGELSDSFLNLHSSENNARKVDHFQKESEQLDSDIFEKDDEPDESWAESILEEMEKESKSPSNPAVFESYEAPKKPEPVRPTKSKSDMLMDFDDDFEIPPSASQVVNQASHDVDFDFGFEERWHKFRPIGWLVIFLLLALLALQYAWYQRDTFARLDQWRGLYQVACDLTGCELPDQVNLDAISASIDFREHKDSNLANIHIADVILTNKAPFKQAFPDLLLQYTDVNGKLVADQSFSPKDYLKGEMTGVQLMPVNTRIYVLLPLRKPPANAVNYQLLLSSPI